MNPGPISSVGSCLTSYDPVLSIWARSAAELESSKYFLGAEITFADIGLEYLFI